MKEKEIPESIYMYIDTNKTPREYTLVKKKRKGKKGQREKQYPLRQKFVTEN